MNKRLANYNILATKLASLSDQCLNELVANATPIGTSIGGTSALLEMDNKKIFVKKIPISDIERQPDNKMFTKNIFNLPLYYQYGIGSKGFGVWRELAAHILSTNWVITGECENFPILYHWRILPSSNPAPDEAKLRKLKKDVEYWNNSSAIHDRLKANLYGSANIVLFLEYFPENLYQWFGNQVPHGDSAIETACKMMEKQLTQTILFMKSQNFIHFDAHFQNILTDGNLLYFSDFGLAISTTFDLSEEERKFFDFHDDYDSYSIAINLLHCLITHCPGKEKWIESLRDTSSDNLQSLPPYILTLIKKYASTALIMDEFYCALQKNKKTAYPMKELKLSLNQTFTFKPPVESQKELIYNWLKQDYISEWIHGQGLQNTLTGLEKFFQYQAEGKVLNRKTEITQHWVGYDGDKPFVYLLTSNVFKQNEFDEYAKYSEIEGFAITLDIFICDKDYLGKGLATDIIRQFLVNHCSDVAEVFIDPEKENKRAIHVYQKVGFQIVGEFVAAWHPVPHYIMKLNIKDLKQK